MNMQYFQAFDEAAIERVFGEWKPAHSGMGVLALVLETDEASVGGLRALFARQAVPLVGAIFPALINGGEFGV